MSVVQAVLAHQLCQYLHGYFDLCQSGSPVSAFSIGLRKVWKEEVPKTPEQRRWKGGQTQPTGSIQINESLRPQVIMEAFATVLLQLDLLDPHRLGGHLTLLLP